MHSLILSPLIQHRLLLPPLYERQAVCRAKRKGEKSRRQPPQPPIEKAETPEIMARGDEKESVEGVELSRDGKKIGWSFFSMDDGNPKPKPDEAENESDLTRIIDLTSPAMTSDDQELPVYTRDQVLSSCFSVSTWIFCAGLVLRGFAHRAPEVLGRDQELSEALLTLSPAVSLSHVAVTVAAIAVVSGARVFFYQNWKEFARATDRSNGQVLPSLQFPDLLFVSFVPGISEELFFRGGLLTAISPDWKGALLSGLIFAAVGCLYGFAFLFTRDIYVPIFAHSGANLFSAMNWIAANTDKPNED